MARADTAHDIGQFEVSMLGIYLNDHLAGATAGTELAHRMARSHGDGQNGSTLRRLAAEIAQDRAALLDIMAALGIKVRRYKVGAAWIGEKAARLRCWPVALRAAQLSQQALTMRSAGRIFLHEQVDEVRHFRQPCVLGVAQITAIVPDCLQRAGLNRQQV